MNFQELIARLESLEKPTAEDAGGTGAGSVAVSATPVGKDEELDECGMDMMSPMSPKQQDNVSMNVSMNGSGAGGIRDLLDILKDMEHGGDQDMGMPDIKAAIIDEPMDEYANSPSEKYGSVGDMTTTGNDMHSKGGEAPKVNGGGNPWNVTPESLLPGLQELYAKLKEQDSGDVVDEEWYNPMTWFGGGQKPAAAPAKPGAKPAAGAATKPAAPPDPKVQALQQDLIKKGAQIKADGIMGPKTQAAMKQFGGQSTAAAAAPAPAAAPAAPEAPAAPAAPEAPQTSMDDSDDAAAQPFVPPTATAGAPPPPAAGGATNAATLKAAQDKAAGNAPAPTATAGTPPPAATAAPAPAGPAPAPAPAGQMAQLQQMAQQGLQSGQPASTDDLMKQAQSALANKMKGGYSASPTVAEKVDYSRQARTTENSELTAMLRIAGLR